MNATVDAPISGTDKRLHARTYDRRPAEPNMQTSMVDALVATIKGKSACASEDKIEWIHGTVDMALAMDRFFPSDLYSRVMLLPASANWWGVVYRIIGSLGYRKDRSIYQTSRTGTANGREEYLWVRCGDPVVTIYALHSGKKIPYRGNTYDEAISRAEANGYAQLQDSLGYGKLTEFGWKWGEK